MARNSSNRNSHRAISSHSNHSSSCWPRLSLLDIVFAAAALLVLALLLLVATDPVRLQLSGDSQTKFSFSKHVPTNTATVTTSSGSSSSSYKGRGVFSLPFDGNRIRTAMVSAYHAVAGDSPSAEDGLVVTEVVDDTDDEHALGDDKPAPITQAKRSSESAKKADSIVDGSWLPVLGPIPTNGTGPLFGARHKGTDAIFGLAFKYKRRDFLRFCGSLRKAGFDGDIVLSVDPLNKLLPGVEKVSTDSYSVELRLRLSLYCS